MAVGFDLIKEGDNGLVILQEEILEGGDLLLVACRLLLDEALELVHLHLDLGLLTMDLEDH